MNKKVLGLISLLVLVLAVTSMIFLNKRKYIALDLKTGDVLEAIYGLGKVKSRQTYDIKIGIMTSVEEVFVQEGDFVEKGRKLISFQGTSTFKAPFDGTVTLIELKKGEVALPSVPILRIENLKDKYIEVSLEQDAALKVKKGQKAQVIFESLKGNKLDGSLKSIYPKNREFIAHIESQNIPENILPGMTADVVIQVGKKQNVLLVPVKAITDGRVVRLRNEKKSVVEVEIGNSDGIWAELVSGDLKLTDQLMVKDKK